jgi:hypothetical protein
MKNYTLIICGRPFNTMKVHALNIDVLREEIHKFWTVPVYRIIPYEISHKQYGKGWIKEIAGPLTDIQLHTHFKDGSQLTISANDPLITFGS